MNITKKFDPELHAKYDEAGRNVVKHYLQRRFGLVCNDNPNIYGVDLIANWQGKPRYYVEVEVRQWEPHCPHSTIHIASRKQKLFDNDMRTLFFALSQSMDFGYYIDTEHVMHQPRVEVPNKLVKRGEYFYNVPVRYFTYDRMR